MNVNKRTFLLFTGFLFPCSLTPLINSRPLFSSSSSFSYFFSSLSTFSDLRFRFVVVSSSSFCVASSFSLASFMSLCKPSTCSWRVLSSFCSVTYFALNFLYSFIICFFISRDFLESRSVLDSYSEQSVDHYGPFCYILSFLRASPPVSRGAQQLRAARQLLAARFPIG